MPRKLTHLSLDENTMERLRAIGERLMLPPGRVIDRLAVEALERLLDAVDRPSTPDWVRDEFPSARSALAKTRGDSAKTIGGGWGRC